MKYVILLTASCLPFLPIDSARGLEQKDCLIEFKVNSSVVLENKKELDSCLDKLGEKNIEAVTIIGSASNIGSTKRNKELSYERGLTVSRIINAKFPNAIIKSISVGANEEIGKKAHIHFVLSSQNELEQSAKMQQKVDLLEQQNSSLEAELEKKKQNLISEKVYHQNSNSQGFKSFLDENPNFRIAARLGVDSTRIDQRRSYMSGGAEVSWLNRESFTRPEFGIKATTSIDNIRVNGDSVSRVTNAYGFAGLGGTAMGLVGGIRLLLGGEWIDIGPKIPQQDHAAVGGEARVGYEWGKGMSVFASYALTQHIQMVGIDVGVSL